MLAPEDAFDFPALLRIFPLLLLVFAPQLQAAAVEVALVQTLDEPRGFCIDMPGFQARARPDRPLHTHSCYSYQGQLAVDQAFDGGLIAKGVFRILAFDRCMTAPVQAAGGRLALEACDGSPAQQFRHQPAGQITVLAAPEYCVTAGEGPSRAGGGGQPVHLIRDLTLEPCDRSRDERQRWRLRESFEGL
jgi:hypothetical protein